ncbi:hypothetical protein Gotur_027892 [Gossypium turneri]
MGNEFLDKVEDNAIVRIWSEKVQLEKGDSLAKDYVSELWDYTLDHGQQKGECKCIPWKNLRDLILAHPDVKKKVDVLALRDNYKKKVKEISQAWNQVHRMRKLAVGPMTAPEYGEWRSKRINDNIPESYSEGVRPMEEYLQVIPSELEIIRLDFEKRNLELERKIERLEEEKMHLRMDVDVQKLEAERLKKGKNKV